MANLLFPELRVSFLSIDHLFPAVININCQKLAKIPGPRLIKSHEYFDPRYKQVIYIVRDPRDIVISYYHFLLKQDSLRTVILLKHLVSDLSIGMSTSSSRPGTRMYQVGLPFEWCGQDSFC